MLGVYWLEAGGDNGKSGSLKNQEQEQKIG